VLYLSPDRKYLSPLLYDLALDPLAEMRAQNEQLSHDLAAGAAPPLGAAGAAVTIVEFSDFQCPYCKRMTDVLEKEVLPKQDGKVNIVFRNFPLSIHPWAKSAAEIAECAELQQPEAFWAMHDFFFQNQQTLQPATVKAQATAFAATVKGIDQSKFSACVDRELGLGPVTQDQQLGDKMGIHGTPTLFINGVRFDGMRSGDEINQLVERAARGELVAPPAPVVDTTSRAATVRTGAAAAECTPVGGKPNVQ
jgi:protein-disulfide isomerase